MDAETGEFVRGGARRWVMRGVTLDLDRPRIMAVVNVTPDSFSDGGQHDAPDRAVAYCERALADGAAMLDIGGESTRPGAARVDVEEQIRRVVPVVERLRAMGIETPISVDTTRATVARAAIEAGANAINDVSGGTEDPDMLGLAAETGAGIILMHRLRPPSEDRFSDQYSAQDAPDYAGDVVAHVREALAGMIRSAEDAGVERARIVVDPGLGFGKTVAQNFALAGALHDMSNALECETLSAASRKSFLGRAIADALGLAEPPPAAQRDAATLALSVMHALRGVRLLRVHDVRGHAEGLGVIVSC